MKKWIDRMLGGDDKAVRSEAPAAAEPESGAEQLAIEVDAAYYRWLTASGGYQAGADVEEHVLDLVRTLAADPLAASGLCRASPS